MGCIKNIGKVTIYFLNHNNYVKSISYKERVTIRESTILSGYVDIVDSEGRVSDMIPKNKIEWIEFGDEPEG